MFDFLKMLHIFAAYKVYNIEIKINALMSC